MLGVAGTQAASAEIESEIGTEWEAESESETKTESERKPGSKTASEAGAETGGAGLSCAAASADNCGTTVVGGTGVEEGDTKTSGFSYVSGVGAGFTARGGNGRDNCAGSSLVVARQGGGPNTSAE